MIDKTSPNVDVKGEHRDHAWRNEVLKECDAGPLWGIPLRSAEVAAPQKEREKSLAASLALGSASAKCPTCVRTNSQQKFDILLRIQYFERIFAKNSQELICSLICESDEKMEEREQSIKGKQITHFY